MAKTETVVETVKMLDGRVVDFSGKRKILKESGVNADGDVYCRLDFRNGESRVFICPQLLINQAAGHGLEQKLGDVTAGEADIDDAVEAVDQLMERLGRCEWNSPRESSGMAGTSSLIRALVEHTGKPVEKIRAFLEPKTKLEKDALKGAPGIKAIFDRIEAEKAAKAKPVDVSGLLDELEGDVA